MEGFNHRNHRGQHDSVGVVDPTSTVSQSSRSPNNSVGSSVQSSELEKSLNDALATNSQGTSQASGNDHDHAPSSGPFEFHVSLDQVASQKTLDTKSVDRSASFDFGSKGDFLDPKGGNNVVIGSGDNDVILGNSGGFNTITTGTGRDTIVLGKETTNRVFDFDPANDRFVLAGINPKDIVIAQGKNPGKGGLEQPLDSVNNALVIDKTSGHILAALPFVKASDLNESHFTRDTPEATQTLKSLKDAGFNTQQGDGQLTGSTSGHERLIGGQNDDFLFATGDDGIKFNTARATSGATEFPFPNDSQGSSEVNLSLKDGVLSVNGSYQNFNAFPLFSQGETTIAPDAKILNGSDPVALINNFLKVPNDAEGNSLSGTHLHFSPSGDDRGNFADATVIRYFTNTSTSPTSGTISGEFHLTPVEQAALIAGNLYMNIHTNVSSGDGKSGFPTGENRINFNQDIVQFV